MSVLGFAAAGLAKGTGDGLVQVAQQMRMCGLVGSLVVLAVGLVDLEHGAGAGVLAYSGVVDMDGPRATGPHP